MTVVEERTQYGQTAIQGTAWRYLSYFSGKFMVFLSTIILARLLSKDDFGVVGYALTSIAFLDIASDLGVAEAVVYSRDDRGVYSTAFWSSIFIGLLLFGISWALAPFIALYFRDDRVIAVFRVMALTFPFSALGSTHDAILRKTLSFGRSTIPEFLRAFGKGLISVILAFMGFGVWSLALGQLCGTLISSIVLWIVTPWRPSFEFHVSKISFLMNYGLKYIGTDLLSALLLNLDYLLVGRYLGAAALGVYTLAYRMPELLILQFARILSKVIFPIYTKMREVPGGLARGFAKATSYISLLTVPLGLGLMLVAAPFTQVFLSEKWMEAVPVIQAISLYAMLLSLIHNATSAYKATANFGVMTWLSLGRLTLLFPALWWAAAIRGSIVAVGWMHVLVALVSSLGSLYVAARVLGLPLKELAASMKPALFAGAGMAAAVYGVLFLLDGAPAWGQLLAAIAVGGLIYFLGLWFAGRSAFLDVVEKIRAAIIQYRPGMRKA